jgi:hypothetical protein
MKRVGIEIQKPNKCINCGEDKKNIINRLCVTCYHSRYRRENPEILKEYRKRNKEKILKCGRKSYMKNKDKIINSTYERFKRYRLENLKYLESVKPFICEICGYNKCFEALDFHHINPKQKKRHNDKMSAWLYGCCPKTFKKKIDTIDFLLLCSNCHRELHAKEHKAKYKPQEVEK